MGSIPGLTPALAGEALRVAAQSGKNFPFGTRGEMLQGPHYLFSAKGVQGGSGLPPPEGERDELFPPIPGALLRLDFSGLEQLAQEPADRGLSQAQAMA